MPAAAAAAPIVAAEGALLQLSSKSPSRSPPGDPLWSDLVHASLLPARRSPLERPAVMHDGRGAAHSSSVRDRCSGDLPSARAYFASGLPAGMFPTPRISCACSLGRLVPTHVLRCQFVPFLHTPLICSFFRHRIFVSDTVCCIPYIDNCRYYVLVLTPCML